MDTRVVGVSRGQAWVPRHKHLWRSVRGEAATKLISPTAGGANLPVINHASTTQAADVCSEDPWAPWACRRVMDDAVPHLPTFRLRLLSAATEAVPREHSKELSRLTTVTAF